MDWKAMAKRSEGLHTVETFASSLGIGRQTAINYLHALRAAGLVETRRGRRGKRMYSIVAAPAKAEGYPGLNETISRWSPMKLTGSGRSDHEISIEEAIARAAASSDYRVTLAAVALFRRVTDWWTLYNEAKKERSERMVGALYSVSRRCFRVRSMDGRVSSLLRRRAKAVRKGTGLDAIENEWGVRLPFSDADMERLKSIRDEKQSFKAQFHAAQTDFKRAHQIV